MSVDLPAMPLLRQAEAQLRRLAAGFPVVALTGPRQSGKTTLARQVFAHLPYLSLEDPETRELAHADPRGLLARFPDGAVLDEIQRAPELLSWLQTLVDGARRMGHFVITGSQQFGLRADISQSLAGRVGLVELLPLSLREIATARTIGAGDLDPLMFRGGYPALYDPARAALTPGDWCRAYVSTYIERDVRQVLGVRDLATFERFVRMCAARSGQLLNVAALASDAGISAQAARQWLSVLEASYVIRLLQPWHENFGKRLVKMPKLYFLDTGLLCWLLRIESADSLATHALRGPIFETWVLAETLKHRHNQGLPPDLHFWRDNHGVEVDLVYPHRDRLHPVEIKSGMTFSLDWLRAGDRMAAYAGGRCAAPVVVYGGERSYQVQGASVMSWLDFGRLPAG